MVVFSLAPEKMTRRNAKISHAENIKQHRLTVGLQWQEISLHSSRISSWYGPNEPEKYPLTRMKYSVLPVHLKKG